MVAERRYQHHEWDRLPARTRRAMRYFQHALSTWPQFIAYAVADLPSPIPTLARKLFGLPLLTWTVRSAADRDKAARYADQMIFEGFRP
jgi:glycerophosphoryl diester phosphodiesterase